MTTRHAPTSHEMTIADVAAALGVSRSRAAEYVREGMLAYREVPGRHTPSERLVPAAHVRALAQARQADRALFRDLRAEGWLTVAEIAARTERAPWTRWEEVRQVREALKEQRGLLLRRPDHLSARQQAQVEALLASPVGPTLTVARAFLTD